MRSADGVELDVELDVEVIVDVDGGFDVEVDGGFAGVIGEAGDVPSGASSVRRPAGRAPGVVLWP